MLENRLNRVALKTEKEPPDKTGGSLSAEGGTRTRTELPTRP